MDDSKQMRRHQAGGHPTRVAILTLLESQDGQGGLPATAVVHELPDTPTLSTVAYHLRVLCQAELVREDSTTATPVYALAS